MGESEKIVVVRDFPQVISGAAGDFCKLYSRVLEPAPQFFYMAYLTCLGAVIGDRVQLDLEIGEDPRLYTVLLGETAKARKSTAIRKTVEFFRDALGRSSLNVSKGVGSAEGLEPLFKKGKNLLLSLDEFDSFISKTGIRNSVLLQAVGSLFHDTEYENATKGTHILIEDGHLSLLAASTVDTFREMNNPEFIKVGFDNRLFLVPGSTGELKAAPKRITDSEKDPLKRHLEDVLEFVGGGISVKIEDYALMLYVDWYHYYGNSDDSGRLDTYALRLMTLVAINDLSDLITEEIVHKALDLAVWQEKMRRLYNPILADTVYSQWEQKIVRLIHDRGPMSEAELYRFTNAKRNSYAFDVALKTLVSRSKVLEPKTEGRTKKYHLVLGEGVDY